MAIAEKRLMSIVHDLTTRPGHEKVRALLNELCTSGLDVPSSSVSFEVPIPRVRGRIDALFGETVFEFKRDLRNESSDAEEQLARYLTDQEKSKGKRILGIATDGAEFRAYQLQDGRLNRLQIFEPDADDPRDLLRWLDTSVTLTDDLAPDTAIIRAEFGRDSLVFKRAISDLSDLWIAAELIPEAAQKRDLWRQHLEFVYGTLIDADQLFLQHTYLTVIAKTMAYQVLAGQPGSAQELLSGTPFVEVGLKGAIETDFFDWPLLVDGGEGLVNRLAKQVARFRLSEVNSDVLKTIYESLIDPAQRHYLGEYYTPDWLAEWMCEESIQRPLAQHVLDPACGSGTFLFHAIRRFLDAAKSNGMPLDEALVACTEQIIGLDVHPVAVLFARVTYLLAIGSERLKQRNTDLFVPVYLGDSLQWNVDEFFTEQVVDIPVPDHKPLRFPGSVAADPQGLEQVLATMRELSDLNAPTDAFHSWLEANVTFPKTDKEILVESFEHMRALHQAGRNHIWTYVIRNLTRPLWISLKERKPDVVIGNPPWLKFNAMSKSMQGLFKGACQKRGLWIGGKVATHQDLSAYFFARSAELYGGLDTRIAFVMPMAAMTRTQYRTFLSGVFKDPKKASGVVVRFTDAWQFDERVEPLFPIPSVVLFAERTEKPRELPRSMTAFEGRLLHRDARALEAKNRLQSRKATWPKVIEEGRASPYKELFKQGATLVPRRLILVDREEAGKLGGSKTTPLVVGRARNLDKAPWKNLTPPRGRVEAEFIRPVLLGESIAPFRILSHCEAVIPWSGSANRVMDAASALTAGNLNLSRWLRDAEAIWESNKSSSTKLDFAGQIDYYGKLSGQFPQAAFRVVYTKSGNKPAACVVEDPTLIVDHKLYWCAVESRAEGSYLTSFLNSEVVREKISSLQSRGLFGPRDFDKLMLGLSIPKFEPTNELHQSLARLATEAELFVRDIDIHPSSGFQAARKAIRLALSESGKSAAIDKVIAKLL